MADISGAGFDTFQVESLPAELDLAVVVHLLMYEKEEADLLVSLVGPGGENRLQVSHRFTGTPGRLHRAGSVVRLTEALQFPPYPVVEEGPYAIELEAGSHSTDPLVLDQQRRTLFFNVREGLPEGY
jgi:hypothetical protein